MSLKPLKSQLRAAELARKNRLEIVKALSTGQVTRRELMKWGLLTGAGALAHIGGLSPFVSALRASHGSSIPTGFEPSPLPANVTAFSQPMPRMDVLPRIPNPMTAFTPTPTAEANTTQQLLDPALVAAYPGGNTGPVEGRPPGILGRAGWSNTILQPGERVTVHASPAKNGDPEGIIARVTKADGKILSNQPVFDDRGN